MSEGTKYSETIPENKFRKEEDAINNNEKWLSDEDPSLITGQNCFQLDCNFSDNIKDKDDIIALVSSFFRLMPMCYLSGYGIGL